MDLSLQSELDGAASPHPLLDTVSRLYAQHRDVEAEAVLRSALVDNPADLDLWYGLGTMLRVQGHYLEGFRAYEARPQRRSSHARSLPYPEWEGAPLAGRSIFVCGEQGIGDEIMFGRFIPELRRLGASRITVACRSELLRVFGQLGADLLIPRNAGPVEIRKHDCWVMLGSLPHRLGVTLETLSGAPYLQAEAQKRGGIAIVERGNPNHWNDARRSIHDGALRAALPTAEVLAPEGDVLDSLRRIAGLDLLVTVDTSWAHMAGALGVPCCVLLPAHGSDWRWLRGRRDSPWYGSIELYRQPEPGDWASPIRALQTRLAAYASVSREV